MSKYRSIWTGSQIDDAVNKVRNPDAEPTADSSNLVTSGGVKSALDLIFQTATSIETNPKTDLDAVYDPGLYKWSDTAAKIPLNAPITSASLMLVMVSNPHSASPYTRLMQIVFAHNASRDGIYYRWCWDDTWTAWKQLSAS